MGRRPDGRTQRKHVQRRTKADLRDAVREVERQRDTQGYTWTHGDLTLGAWLEHWLGAVLPMTVRWKTLSTYRSQVRCHVLPHLGAWRMSEIQPEHLESHYRRMQTDGLSVHTIGAVHRVLRSALNEAVRRRRLASNPALIARPPRREDVEVEPLSVAESRRILAAAQTTLHPARWSIALSLGLRQGEVLGLLWGDVDLDEPVLRVRRSVQRPHLGARLPRRGQTAQLWPHPRRRLRAPHRRRAAPGRAEDQGVEADDRAAGAARRRAARPPRPGQPPTPGRRPELGRQPTTWCSPPTTAD
jgi:integrase